MSGYAHILSFVALLALFHPRAVLGHSSLRTTSFPVLAVVNTTRDIASQFSATWDIQKKQSKRLDDGEAVQLSVVVHDEDDMAQLHHLQTSDLLQYETQKMTHRNLAGISSQLSCYRTVDETFASMNNLAAQYSSLVTVSTIGVSWLKQQGQGGHDIKAMVLTAPSSAPKHDMMLVGGHHSRELPPPETLMRWAEYMLANYEKNADITMVLERTNIHIVPIANPDGREIVQDHPDWMYRKNAHTHGCVLGAKNDGVDLNRNYPMWFGESSGSSSMPCNAAFRGDGALTEPESNAIYLYAKALFSADMKKGTSSQAEALADQACPEDATGIFIDVHSFGDFVYFPWGIEDKQSPNHRSLLTMAAKLAKPGNYELWGPGQDGFLYFVSGDVTDTTYGMDCVPSFGYELGSAWYAQCSELETDIFPKMKLSLLYAAKTVSAPYKIPLGPDIVSIHVDASNRETTTLRVEASDDALIVGHAKYDGEMSQPIASIKVWADIHPYDDASIGLTMTPEDGSFNSVSEAATLTIDTRRVNVLYFQATDSQGYDGPVSAVFAQTWSSDTGSPDITGGCFLPVLQKVWGWWESLTEEFSWR